MAEIDGSDSCSSGSMLKRNNLQIPGCGRQFRHAEANSLAVPSYLCPLKPALLNNDLVQCLHIDYPICPRLSDLASDTIRCLQFTVTSYLHSVQHIEHECQPQSPCRYARAATPWRTKFYECGSSRLYSGVLLRVRRNPTNLGRRNGMSSSTSLLLSSDITPVTVYSLT